MQPLAEIAAAQYFTRRQFFSRCALGLGSIALASMMNDRRAFGRARAAAPQPDGAQAAAFRAARQEYHLPLHGRRPVTARIVRL